jgi:hypothetical protein
MKKLFILFAMMIAALSFIACGGDDDKLYEGINKEQKTLKMDGESYYASELCIANRSNYISIVGVNNLRQPTHGFELDLRLSPSNPGEIKEGEVFDTDKMRVLVLRSLNEIPVENPWNDIEGSITIKRITSMEMTIVINDLILENVRNGVKHTISGTAVLTSGIYDSNNNLLPFE